MCQHSLWGEDSEAVKKPLLRKQNNIKKTPVGQGIQNWTKEQWNKVLRTDKSNFKIFRSNRRVYAWQSWWKSCNPLYHTNHKAWRKLCYGVGTFANWSQGFAPGERQIESDWLSQHTAASRNPIVASGLRICTHAR